MQWQHFKVRQDVDLQLLTRRLPKLKVLNEYLVSDHTDSINAVLQLPYITWPVIVLELLHRDSGSATDS